jgi:hypothetical protein
MDVVAKIHDTHALISEQLKLADVCHTTYHNRLTKQPFNLQETTVFGSSILNVVYCQLVTPQPSMRKISSTLHWPLCHFCENIVSSPPPPPLSLYAMPECFSHFQTEIHHSQDDCSQTLLPPALMLHVMSLLSTPFQTFVLLTTRNAAAVDPTSNFSPIGEAAILPTTLGSPYTALNTLRRCTTPPAPA